MLKEMRCSDGSLRISKVFKQHDGSFQWMYRIEIFGDFPENKVKVIMAEITTALQISEEDKARQWGEKYFAGIHGKHE